MDIDLHRIAIRDICKGYVNDEEEGVTAFEGKLNIRPKYQREFVYKDEQRDAVIETIRKGYPLNVMYWAKNDDGTFEVMDGQQRTLSFCLYVDGKFSINYQYFHNLEEDEKNQILNYETFIYHCKGNPKEKLEWFKIINIAGVKLSDQELRNVSYTGTWLSDAKKFFSKNSCPAYNLASNYVKGSPIRQEYLETAIRWISSGEIEKYMSEHQNDPNANELWVYFQAVISWIDVTFRTYRREMKGLPWGELYNAFKDKQLDSKKLETEIKDLMIDDEVKSKSGIYLYVLTRKEKYLNLRTFSDQQKRQVYETQQGICPGWKRTCEKHFEIEEMEADHIKPWHEGGKTIVENCQMLCKEDNRRKSGI